MPSKVVGWFTLAITSLLSAAFAGGTNSPTIQARPCTIPVEVTARALAPGSSPGAIPVAVTIRNGLPGPLEFTTFALQPNGWNGETVHLALLDVHREGATRELVLARPTLAVPHRVSGMARHVIEPSAALEIHTDLAVWTIDGGWLPGRYEATVRVERLSTDEGRCQLSVASGPLRFEVPAGITNESTQERSVAPPPHTGSGVTGAGDRSTATHGVEPLEPPAPPAVRAPGTSLAEAGLPLVASLRQALHAGTPTERSQAMTAIRELKAIAFLQEIVALADDPTPLPREGDTGWGFVGHQAASLLSELAVAMRRMSREEMGTNAYSFHGDQWRGGDALKRAGRLAEVRTNWQRWLDDLRGDQGRGGRPPSKPATPRP